MARFMTLVRTLLREPLVHFLLFGALLFGWFARQGGGSGPGSTRITITPGLVEHLASGFTRTWQRPPTDAELKALIDDHVKEEIATREALAMGLDEDDAIIRRRLRQKLEFLVEDVVDQAPTSDAELQAWLDAHPEAFRAEAKVALRQVYVSVDRRGASARRDAERLLARLRAAGPGARSDDLGDASMLPRELPLGPLSEVARAFGKEFAARIDAVPPGKWTGPVESPYGLHLVLVVERVAPETPALADVRPLVERELQAERRKEQLQALYERLLEKYTVSVEMPKEEQQEQASSAKSAGGKR
jgi:parvulin-like peptidyl-prolyl isomerase